MALLKALPDGVLIADRDVELGAQIAHGVHIRRQRAFGGIAGIGLGYLITLAIRQIPNANLDQAYIPGWAIMMSLAFSAGVGIFFGVFPAFKAARLNPIEALRNE